MIRGTVAGALRVLSGSTPPTVLYFIFVYFLISNSSTPLNFEAVTKVTTSFLPLSSFILTFVSRTNLFFISVWHLSLKKQAIHKPKNMLQR